MYSGEQDDRLRAIAAVQSIFQPEVEASLLVDEFCRRMGATPRYLYELIAGDQIALLNGILAWKIRENWSHQSDGYSETETVYRVDGQRVFREVRQHVPGFPSQVVAREWHHSDPGIPISFGDWLASQSAPAAELRAMPYPKRSPSPCQKCQHYVGKVSGGEQGGNWLCCAMHPYGPEGEECPDREEAIALRAVREDADLRSSYPHVSRQIPIAVHPDGHVEWRDVTTFED